MKKRAVLVQRKDNNHVLTAHFLRIIYDNMRSLSVFFCSLFTFAQRKRGKYSESKKIILHSTAVSPINKTNLLSLSSLTSMEYTVAYLLFLVNFMINHQPCNILLKLKKQMLQKERASLYLMKKGKNNECFLDDDDL